MCHKASENLDHLFVDCVFSQSVWALVLQGLNTSLPSKIPVIALFSSWKARYPWVLKIPSLWNRIWLSIPKFICWNLWLTRNDLIFNNIEHFTLKVVAKAKALLMEALGNHSSKLDTTLSTEERSWLGTLLIRVRKKILDSPTSSGEYEHRMRNFKIGGENKEM